MLGLKTTKKTPGRNKKRSDQKRKLQLESLENRQLLAADLAFDAVGACHAEAPALYWHNIQAPTDIDNDGELSPLDALLVVNELNVSGGGALAHSANAVDSYRVDVNADGQLTPIDALMIINQLNTGGASTSPFDDFEADCKSSNAIEFQGTPTQFVLNSSGTTSVPLQARSQSENPLRYGFTIEGDTNLVDVQLQGSVLNITPRDEVAGKVRINTFASDGQGLASASFDVQVNQAEFAEASVDSRLLSKWQEFGAQVGLGAPLAGSTTDSGETSQKFENGELRWSSENGYGITNSQAREFVLTTTQSERTAYTRRPTLLVITQGANTGGHFTYPWQTELARNLRSELENADSQVHSMIVQWDSFKPNDRGVRDISSKVKDWLGQRQQEWNVVLVGHSRGAIFNHELAQEIAGSSNIRNLSHIMVDPTASVTHGDQYPSNVPLEVDHSMVYDDGYVFIPLAVRDGLPVAGAGYERVSLDGFGYQDTVGSHNAIASWYAEEGYQNDLAWLLSQETPTSKPFFVHEDLETGNQLLVAPGPESPNHVVDIGIDTNENGNFHGYITIFPIGGVDVTIGKQGLDVSAGVIGYGSGGVSLSSRGFTASVNVYNTIGGGLIIGNDETRLDVNVFGVNLNLFGKGAGVYVGGNKLEFDISDSIASGSIGVHSLESGGKRINQTFRQGSKTFQETINANGQLVSKAWNNSGKWVTQEFNSIGELVREKEYFDAAGKHIHKLRKWSGTKLTDFEQFAKDGWKEVNKYLNSKEQWVSQRFNAAGEKLKEWIYYDAAGKQLKQFRGWADGKLTDLEQFTTDGWKKVNKYLNSKGQWVSQRFNAAGEKLKEWIYYDAAGKKLQQFRGWADGKLTDLEQFSTAGWKKVNKFLNSKGKWVSQKLNSSGKVISQWVYHGGYGSQLREWAAWDSAGDITNINRYTSKGVRTLKAYVSTKGNWVERHYVNGKEKAVRIWSASGKYLGDKLKNYSDAASKLDPTTKDWWPF